MKNLLIKKFYILLILFSALLPLSGKEVSRLLLPDEIHAVVGIETNVYFKNVFKTVNPDNYAFRVTCRKGSLMQKRWTFLPKGKDTGSYDWTLTVFDDNGKVAEKKITLKVYPATPIPAGCSILVIGDSLTDQNHYVKQLKKNAPALQMIGTNGGLGKDPAKTGVAHEGYGGWTWSLFASERKPVVPKILPYRTNKFLIEKNGKWQLSFDAFFKKYSKGVKPQFITLQLGVNDTIFRTDQNMDQCLQTMERSMDKLIREIRKSAPEAMIGIGLIPPCAGQDAWVNYGCSGSYYQYMKNRWKANDFYLKKVAKMAKTDKNISIIPTVLNLDPENGFPTAMQKVNARSSVKVRLQSNAVHPSAQGGAQMGDTYYCWIIHCLNQKNNIINKK